MIYASYIVLAFAANQFLVALLNLLFYQHYRNKNAPTAFLSVLIPARNEAKNIGVLLQDICNQGYKNIEVLVYNDHSEDNTKAIIQEFELNNKLIRLIDTQSLPKGWLGKNHACHCLAKEAKGEYLLFLDADVRLGETIFSRVLNKAMQKNTDLLSIFPQQEMIHAGEKKTVPIMNYILLTLLPLILVRKSFFSSHAAANGQFMLFKASTYHAEQAHLKMKNIKVEDIAIARYFKKKGLSVACLLGDEDIRCRMYQSYEDAIQGFAKNILMFFGNSYLAMSLFFLLSTFGIVPLILLGNLNFVWIYLLTVISTRVLVSIASKQSVYNNLKYMLSQQLSMGHIMLRSIQQTINKKQEWKGRNIL